MTAFGQSDGYIASAVMLDDGAIGMIGPPGTGFAVNF